MYKRAFPNNIFNKYINSKMIIKTIRTKDFKQYTKSKIVIKNISKHMILKTHKQ